MASRIGRGAVAVQLPAAMRRSDLVTSCLFLAVAACGLLWGLIVGLM